jgi:hypothetical protein
VLTLFWPDQVPAFKGDKSGSPVNKMCHWRKPILPKRELVQKCPHPNPWDKVCKIYSNLSLSAMCCSDKALQIIIKITSNTVQPRTWYKWGHVSPCRTHLHGRSQSFISSPGWGHVVRGYLSFGTFVHPPAMSTASWGRGHFPSRPAPYVTSVRRRIC